MTILEVHPRTLTLGLCPPKVFVEGGRLWPQLWMPECSGHRACSLTDGHEDRRQGSLPLPSSIQVPWEPCQVLILSPMSEVMSGRCR